jgi:hypothetical protein
MVKDLNRIFKLGYECELVWNKHIQIYFDFSKYDDMEYYEPVSVLTCIYDMEFTEHSFQKYVEESCQLFYTWHLQNNNLIQEFLKNNQDNKIRIKIDSLSLGDVSTQVERSLSIDDILDY